jgi:hypothetical protein
LHGSNEVIDRRALSAERSLPERPGTGASYRRLAARLALLSTLALASTASAQPGPGASSSLAETELRPPVVLSDQHDDEPSPPERLQRAQELVSNIQQSSQAVLRQLQVARSERDVVRVLCLNDKLNQVDVALRSAEDRLVALRTAVERADGDRARHEHTVLDVLNDRVRVLVSESNQCVGEETGFIGDAEISVTIDPNLPDDTLIDDSVPPPLVPAAPTVNSPIE